MSDSCQGSDDRDLYPASLEATLEEIATLPVSLTASRKIAIAVGILIERYKIAPEEAFDLLVAVSRHSHRKLRDLASDLVVKGEFENEAATPDRGRSTVARSAAPQLVRTSEARH